MSKRAARVIGLIAIAVLVAGILVSCGGEETHKETVYEDCDTGDQNEKDDDCGYWQKGSEVRMGGQPDMTWLWVWYTWVVVGQSSHPHSGWVPPRGVVPPTRVIVVKGTRKCAMAPAPPRPPAPARPAPARPAPAKPAPQKANKPPVNQAPGSQPRGC